MSKVAELDTIREVSDELWSDINKVLDDVDPPQSTDRPRVGQRHALDGNIYRLRSSCQWNHLPVKFRQRLIGAPETFQRSLAGFSRESGRFFLVERCNEIGAVQQERQATNRSLGKARFGWIMLASTQRTGARAGRRKASWLMAMVGHSA